MFQLCNYSKVEPSIYGINLLSNKLRFNFDLDVFAKIIQIKYKCMNMNEIFPGFYKKSDESIKELWDIGLITFDANILLSLYRYSDETRKELFALLRKLEAKIWLTHQVALEYNRNRCEVISEQEKKYLEFQEQICQIEKALSSKKQPPFLSDGLYKSLTTVFNKVKVEVQIRIEEYGDYLTTDPIYNEINDIFLDKIDNSFSKDEYKEIVNEGKLRYENKIPPGFEDEKTKGDDKKFGDLILWKQILRKSTEMKMPIIFVTNETKKDWWWKLKNDKILGPRQELVEEMLKMSGVHFHMYSLDRFLEFGPVYLNEKSNKKAIEEIKEFTKADVVRVHNFLGKVVSNKIMEDSESVSGFSLFNTQIGNVSLIKEINVTEKQIDEINFHLTLLSRDSNGIAFDNEKENKLLKDKHILVQKKSQMKMQLYGAYKGPQFISSIGSDEM